jgi:hypothetical protein
MYCGKGRVKLERQHSVASGYPLSYYLETLSRNFFGGFIRGIKSTNAKSFPR